MILPIVLYHGAALWSEPCAFEALLNVPTPLRPTVEVHLVRFTYLLHDLSQISDDELREGAQRTALAKLAALCFKHARGSTDVTQMLTRWMSVVREVTSAPHGLEALAQVMRYILEVSDRASPTALQALLEREIGPQAKETLVTVGQQLIEQGRQQGIEQGIEQGRQQGIEQGREQGIQHLLLRLLRQRFGAEVDPGIEQRVASASSEQLETWAVRVLSAPTLAELFGS
ncbi:MAG: Rpn family recombination-promoting nuclease/putative transposase [Myxococcales bacterium]|nr:Rpn family recombination-promoting nuclease/putative transposase [Myxococcales bacterium]